MSRKIYDISPTLQASLPMWPGDTTFHGERIWHIDEQCPVNVSRITLSTHSGAHADAPLHYAADGAAADAFDLQRYLGPCRVIDVRGCGALVQPQHIAHALHELPPRVLLRTYERVPLQRWDHDFSAVDAAAIEQLTGLGVQLIGIDTPSIDPETSKTMDAHLTIHRHAMGILEGLVLDDVPAGDYELIALPLKLAGLDAAPLRAVLRTWN
ncbi:arylformamidase [Solimonas marina]|uniref:Kynurenine formamidase n=1 Tax=Solimonas marina TaxID=2714601 RepID=A0A969WD51_9GAMM|nr:arylformamidase [Solimonas marina]NKF22620.1 arylformamidase [Solimonas marina]